MRVVGRFRDRSLTCEFKVCPLCGSVNRAECEECHVCAWHGEFEHNEFAIEYALQGGSAIPHLGRPSLSLKARALGWIRAVVARCLGRFDVLA